MSRAVIFRADASLQIGSGHVMRCLTLATALREQGVTCHFVCREHPGNLIDQIRDRGFAVTALITNGLHLPPVTQDRESLPAHAAWLGVDWQTDAEATRGVLQSISPDWLVVDHYALDHAWEQVLRSHCTRLMVIDDLADRLHDCDLLLDQNLGREAMDYVDLVPATCTVLTGTRYALLRPEFAALREYSLQRRNPPQLRQLLVTMGGMDQSNATGQVLDALRQCPLPRSCRVTVIMGLHAPWLTEVQAQAAYLPWPCEVKVNVSNMAQLMADSDIAIGAAGSTSWERCVLGLPTLMVVLAKNQQDIASALEDVHAAVRIDLSASETMRKCLQRLIQRPSLLLSMSASAAQICDGSGLQSVVNVLGQSEAS
jgi:UDP-2,4-diacetamido-2,4,6-trideoxy-beta-L-altropyranose hydrolase